MEPVVACEAYRERGNSAAGTMPRRGRRKGKAKSFNRPQRTKAEEEDLKRKVDEYLRLSSMAPDVEVQGPGQEEWLPSFAAEEGQITIFDIDWEEVKAEAMREFDACLATEESARERLKAEPVEESARERLKAEPVEESAREPLKAEPVEESARERLKVDPVEESAAADKREAQEPSGNSVRTEADYKDWYARGFRDGWSSSWSQWFGSYEDTTKVGPMRFTDDPAPEFSAPTTTLQVFSIKVVGTKRGLQWPLDVFGLIVVRDSVDFNRNIIFHRTRDNCQKLTKKGQYLELAGPSRAVVWCDNIVIEVDLFVKGTTESEDKNLSFLAVPLLGSNCGHSYLFRSYETSKLSTLGITLGYIRYSVEATLFIKLIAGSCFRGKFAAFTSGVNKGWRDQRIDFEGIILLDSGCEKVPISDDGDILLSRRVVSVEIPGELKVKICVWKSSESDKNAVEVSFTPKKANRSCGVLDAGFCKMEVTVAWSLLSHNR